MSSEESCSEDPPSTDPTSQRLRLRGFPWRSTRLRNFYDTLDTEDTTEEIVRLNDMLVNKPRRVAPRRQRLNGPPKDGSDLPPKGVARWMVSRRWLNEQVRANPRVAELLGGLIVDHPSFNWDTFLGLGVESDDEPEPAQAQFTADSASAYLPLSQSDTGLTYSFAHDMTSISQ
jgi:hypothetical protein